MKPRDREAYVQRYEKRLAEHGYSPLTLGWGKPGREAVRFAVMADVVKEVGARSVLDVGCGFADLHDFFRARGWEGEYHGVDIVAALLAAARLRDPGLALDEADICDFRAGATGEFDVVVASGVFNHRLEEEENNVHMERAVTRMFELARIAVCVDFMSTHVDFRHPEAWYTDPASAIALARRLSRRFRLRHDYMPFEFALTIWRDDSHSRSVFAPVPGNEGA